MSQAKPVRRKDTAGGRFYQIGDKSYPSVTTILDQLAKPALIEWAATTERAEVIEAAGDLWESLSHMDNLKRMTRLAYEAALKRRLGDGRAWKRVRDQARQIGTEMHDLIQWHLARLVGAPIKQPTTGPEAVIGYRAFTQWLEGSRFQPVWVEFQVWSDVHGYAGTLDVAGNLPHAGAVVAAVGDWKSSKRIYGESVMQVAAYAEALREMGHLPPEAGPVWGFVLRLPKREGDEPGVHLISPEQREAALRMFLSTLSVWRWLQEHGTPQAATVVPDPPTPAARAAEVLARVELASPPPPTPAAPKVDHRPYLLSLGWWLCGSCDVLNGPGWGCRCGASAP